MKGEAQLCQEKGDSRVCAHRGLTRGSARQSCHKGTPVSEPRGGTTQAIRVGRLRQACMLSPPPVPGCPQLSASQVSATQVQSFGKRFKPKSCLPRLLYSSCLSSTRGFRGKQASSLGSKMLGNAPLPCGNARDEGTSVVGPVPQGPRSDGIWGPSQRSPVNQLCPRSPSPNVISVPSANNPADALPQVAQTGASVSIVKATLVTDEPRSHFSQVLQAFPPSPPPLPPLQQFTSSAWWGPAGVTQGPLTPYHWPPQAGRAGKHALPPPLPSRRTSLCPSAPG